MSRNTSKMSEMVSVFVNFDFKGLRELIKKALDSQIPAQNILEGMQEGMNAIGRKYEEGEYFLSELITGGEFMKTGLEQLAPFLVPGNMTIVGAVVIGTVRGDLHDIGKNLVKILLQSSGFTVHDLDVDVPPDTFIKKIGEVKPDILAMSALLTTSMQEMTTVIDELRKAGLRNSVKVIVGGNSVNEEFGREIGADAATKDAMAGVRISQRWTKR